MEIVQNTRGRWAPPPQQTWSSSLLRFTSSGGSINEERLTMCLNMNITRGCGLIFSRGKRRLFHLILTLSSLRFILLRWAFQAWITAGHEMLTSTSRVWIRCSKHAWYECAPGQSSVAAWTLLGSCNSKGSSLSQQQVGARADRLHNLYKLYLAASHIFLGPKIFDMKLARTVCVPAHFLPICQHTTLQMWLYFGIYCSQRTSLDSIDVLNMLT